MSGESPFSQQSIAKAVHASLDAAFAAIPAGRSHAVIFDGTAASSGGAQMRALYVQRSERGWNVAIEGDVDAVHGVAGSVVVGKSW